MISSTSLGNAHRDPLVALCDDQWHNRIMIILSGVYADSAHHRQTDETT